MHPNKVKANMDIKNISRKCILFNINKIENNLEFKHLLDVLWD